MEMCNMRSPQSMIEFKCALLVVCYFMYYNTVKVEMFVLLYLPFLNTWHNLDRNHCYFEFNRQSYMTILPKWGLFMSKWPWDCPTHKTHDNSDHMSWPMNRYTLCRYQQWALSLEGWLTRIVYLFVILYIEKRNPPNWYFKSERLTLGKHKMLPLIQ